VKKVFVDTGAFLALLVDEDGNHAQAQELFRRAAEEHWQLIITNAVLYETHAVLLVRARDWRRATITFLDLVNLKDEIRAIRLVREHKDKSYSLCDAISFTTMERLRIREAIAFDRHFRDYGRFVVLPSG
jgi:uncharacterized protein